MSLTTVTVTATYQDANGDPVPGFVTFMLSSELQDTSDLTIVPRTRIKRYLDSNGSLSVDLTATNDPTTLPLGATYKVSEYIHNHLERVYNIELDYLTPGGTVDLPELAPVTYTEVFSYVLVGTFNAHTATKASTTELGHVMVDGTTITIDGDGVISSSGGGGGGLTVEEVDDRVAALLVAGANVTLAYDDVANTLTVASTGGGGGGSGLEGEMWKVVFNNSGDVALRGDGAISTARIGA